ncbi:helix-turn-helix domain-containing protein [Paenibacillus septentrionalis]|uniref:Helix-turn-helix domain-containing protein n=1 Tax=Paenibacillus septentrionalis TaxID=429342 RepID=A0ABW1V060_9BACL
MHNVLIVDPNTTTLKETEALIRRLATGFDVYTNTSQVNNVISLLEQQQYSLIIINMKSYNSSGIVLCSRIRQVSRVPILLLGGKNDFRLARKALTYQINDYIPEPLNEGALLSSLRSIKKELDGRYTYYPAAFIPQHTALKKKDDASKAVIDSVKRYVQNELHQNITLKKISRLLHFNCAYLGQKFKNYENMSFNEYLLQQRMEKAKLLLKKTDLKIYEIANEIGYTEIDWFYKKFKEYTGSSANEYRKRYELSRAN